MFKIKRVEIDGFWGNFNLKTDLFEDVNVFIGRNGSGKTTFINFLEAALTADLELLDSLQFSEIRLWLHFKNKSRKIVISRKPDISFDKIKYKIGLHSIEIPLITKELEYRRRQINPQSLEKINNIRDLLNKLVNVSWISVHREILEDEYREPRLRRSSNDKNPVDRRIEDITKRLTSYQLLLQNEINLLSDSFRKEILTNIITRPTFIRGKTTIYFTY
jgi:predicted ATP-dependent endonuclease of OLD family